MDSTAFQVKLSPAFEEKFNQLPVDIQNVAKGAMKKLVEGKHSSIRLHRYSNVRPPYWVFDALTNHSYQVACLREGNTFTLLDIGTHKKIEQKSRK